MLYFLSLLKTVVVGTRKNHFIVEGVLACVTLFILSHEGFHTMSFLSKNMKKYLYFLSINCPFF